MTYEEGNADLNNRACIETNEIEAVYFELMKPSKPKLPIMISQVLS